VGPERCPLSLMSTIEELIGRKSRGSGLEKIDYVRKGSTALTKRYASQKLALTLPTIGSRYSSFADSGHAGLVAGFPLTSVRVRTQGIHVGFEVDKAALGQVFSEYFSFSCHSFHRLPNSHYHPSSRAGVGQIVAYTAGFSLISPKKSNQPTTQKKVILRSEEQFLSHSRHSLALNELRIR
jgi:hypothetical protein